MFIQKLYKSLIGQKKKMAQHSLWLQWAAPSPGGSAACLFLPSALVVWAGVYLSRSVVVRCLGARGFGGCLIPALLLMLRVWAQKEGDGRSVVVHWAVTLETALGPLTQRWPEGAGQKLSLPHTFRS